MELDLSGSAFGKQLKRAARSDAPLCLILGETEAKEHRVQLKWLDSGNQETSTQDELLHQVNKLREKIFRVKSTKKG